MVLLSSSPVARGAGDRFGFALIKSRSQGGQGTGLVLLSSSSVVRGGGDRVGLALIKSSSQGRGAGDWCT